MNQIPDGKHRLRQNRNVTGSVQTLPVSLEDILAHPRKLSQTPQGIDRHFRFRERQAALRVTEMLDHHAEQLVFFGILLLRQRSLRALRNIVVRDGCKTGLKCRIQDICPLVGDRTGRQVAGSDQTEPLLDLHGSDSRDVGLLAGMMLKDIVQRNQV